MNEPAPGLSAVWSKPNFPIQRTQGWDPNRAGKEKAGTRLEPGGSGLAPFWNQQRSGEKTSCAPSGSSLSALAAVPLSLCHPQQGFFRSFFGKSHLLQSNGLAFSFLTYAKGPSTGQLPILCSYCTKAGCFRWSIIIECMLFGKRRRNHSLLSPSYKQGINRMIFSHGTVWKRAREYYL